MLSPEQVVDASFLEARHMLLEIAALLDRYEPAPPQDRTVALLELFAQA